MLVQPSVIILFVHMPEALEISYWNHAQYLYLLQPKKIGTPQNSAIIF